MFSFEKKNFSSFFRFRYIHNSTFFGLGSKYRIAKRRIRFCISIQIHVFRFNPRFNNPRFKFEVSCFNTNFLDFNDFEFEILDFESLEFEFFKFKNSKFFVSKSKNSKFFSKFKIFDFDILYSILSKLSNSTIRPKSNS